MELSILFRERETPSFLLPHCLNDRVESPKSLFADSTGDLTNESSFECRACNQQLIELSAGLDELVRQPRDNRTD